SEERGGGGEGLSPGGPELLKKAPHARKGLALDRNEAQTNEERQRANLCDLFDEVTVFFSSRRRHTRYWRDWSSDVCSSDLAVLRLLQPQFVQHALEAVAVFG